MGEFARARRFYFAGVIASFAIGATSWACSDFTGDDPSTADGGGGEGSTGPDAQASGEGGADASIDTFVPTPPGDFIVFVSSMAHDGKFTPTNGGLEGADRFCATLADAVVSAASDAGDGGDIGKPNPSNDGGLEAGLDAGLAGRKWHAWLSTQAINAKDRIAPRGVLPHYMLLDGTTIFPAGFRFPVDGGGVNVVSHAINLDEQGMPRNSDSVWTNTKNEGRSAQSGDCVEWTDDPAATSSLVGGTAPLSPTSITWTEGNALPCNVPQHVYCFEAFESP